MSDDDPIAAAAGPITGHVNDDHPESLLEYLRAFSDVHDATSATMTGVDRDGFDIEATTPSGLRAVRIPWPQRLERREQVREVMVQMADEARRKLSG